MGQFFAQPGWLWLLAILPALTLLLAHADKHRRRAVAALGQAGRVRQLCLQTPARRGWQNFLVVQGIFLLILACAGPHWGSEPAPVRTPAADLVVVLDVSRSMWSEQPSRRTLAVRAARDLTKTLNQTGTVRLGLILFAAKPQVLTPLTHDYEQVLQVLDEVEAGDLPPDIWPGLDGAIPSGTRLGAALEKGIQLLGNDARRLRDLLLLSDGDDPVADMEYVRGAEAARRQGIPVHVVAVGDPKEASTLRIDGQVVDTILQEKPLQDIAQRTGGAYIPAHRTAQLPLGQMFQELRGVRQVQLLLDQLKESVPESLTGPPRRIPRQGWFLAASLLLLGGSLLIPLRPAPPRTRKNAAMPPASSSRRSLPARIALALLAVSFISAAPLPSVEEHIRQGNAAFHRGQFDQALQSYDRAAACTLDPGLVAFNQGAALFRLGRFGEAAERFRGCLEDSAIDANRRARAYYDLGNALVHQARGVNAALLDQAAQAYRTSLLEAHTDAILQADAAHNLEVARWLWQQALARPKKHPDGPDQEPTPPKKIPEPGTKKKGDEPKNNKADGSKNKEPGKNDGKETEAAKDKVEGKDKQSIPGKLVVLPEPQQVEAGRITPAQSAAFLEDQARRIRQDRTAFRQEAVRGAPGVPNW